MAKNTGFFLIFLSVFTVFLFSGCFSPWRGDDARIILNLSALGRAVNYPPDLTVIDRLEHEITLSSSTEHLSFLAHGASVIEAVIAAGFWEITVITSLDGEMYARGSASADLQAGQDNYVLVLMHEVSSVYVQVVFSGLADEVIDLTSDAGNDVFWFQDIVVTINGNYDSYSWYLDGNGRAESGNSISIQINYNYFQIGRHQLLAVVTKNGIPYSKELIFRVRYQGN
ncbi:MAG: hypothetical protein LBH16_10805 [Treponema sp.]|nr:hypothetical protein [Treponema sp.]